MKLKKINSLSTALATATATMLVMPLISSCTNNSNKQTDKTPTEDKKVDPTPVTPQPEPQPEQKKADPSFFQIENGELKGFNSNKTKEELNEYCKDGVLRLPAVKTITADAFNASLKDAPFGTAIEIAAETTSIGERAFFGNTAQAITFTGGANTSQLTQIGKSAFAFCKNLTSFQLPNGLFIAGGKIENGAFYGCNSLVEINCSLFTNTTVFNPDWAYGSFSGLATTGKVAFSGSDQSSENDKNKMAEVWTKLVWTGVKSGWTLAWKNGDTSTDWANQIKAVPSGYLKIENNSLTGAYTNIWPDADTNFNTVNIPANVTSISSSAKGALFNHTSIKKWNFSNTSITTIPENAFSNITNNDSTVYLPDTVTELGNNAFESWTGNVSLKSSVLTKIGESALSKTHYINKEATADADKNTFTFSSSITNVGDNAFNTSDIKKFDFSAYDAVPASGWSGNSIFANTGSAQTPANYTIKVKTLSGGVEQWQLNDAFSTFLVSHGLTAANWTFDPKPTLVWTDILDIEDNSLKGWKKTSGGTELTPEQVGTIITEFNLGSTLVIPQSVTSIADNAFYNSTTSATKIPTQITAISFADNSTCTTIGQSAFKSATSLTNVAIANSVTNVNQSAFEGCSALNAIDLSTRENFTDLTVGNNAFNNISATGTVSVKDLSSDGNIEQWRHNYAAKNKLSTAGITSLTTLSTSDWKFSKIDGAEAFDITNNTINGWATDKTGAVISDEEKLNISVDKHGTNASLFIPKTVTSIADNAFYPGAYTTEADKAKHATVPATMGNLSFETDSAITSIGSKAFYDNTNLTSVSFGNASSLTTINQYTFVGTKITSLTLPSSLTTVDEGAFYGIDTLTSITFPVFANQITFNAGVFANCSSLATINVATYDAAPQWMYSLTSSTIFDNCASTGTIIVKADNLKDTMLNYFGQHSNIIGGPTGNWQAQVQA